ncbi:MAG: hypothetical protein ACRDV9_15245 [Acidimicrobiia bacterium]
MSENSGRNVVARNVAFQNADNGLDINNRKTTLKNNVATRNVDVGINAVRGVTDGGANVANENFGPVQCRNVSCSPPSGG